MEEIPSLPGSPGVGAHVALQPVSPERVNQLRDSPSPTRPSSRDSSIHEKIQQFNNMARVGPNTAATMTKQLERKTADAALKRAMLGREEAESEMRRYREDARILRRQVDEGKERERRVGERLETVMENYGRAKETYAHTQALWEKEIRRARKETFKSQSSIVKLQDELKASRTAVRSTEELLALEKERSKAREQEAFESRLQLVGVQEQLAQALGRIKAVEQERDAFKTIAKNEEVARIAAEGQIPLPRSEEADDEFASPTKEYPPWAPVDIVSSAASEAEIEELTRLWQWEKQRADRTQEHVEFLEAECQLRCCAGARFRPRRSLGMSSRKARAEPIAIVDPADLAILGRKSLSPVEVSTPVEETVIHNPSVDPPSEEDPAAESQGSRRTTVYMPAEGTFRTFSQMELDAMQTAEELSPTEQTMNVDRQRNSAHYTRTPSVEPPDFALMVKERTSLMSLLNAPREGSAGPAMNIPTTPANGSLAQPGGEEPELNEAEAEAEDQAPACPEQDEAQEVRRSHTSAAFYTVTTTTTVPLREKQNVDPRSYMANGKRSNQRTPSFDVNNPALTPTMTREQALAQIRERRGRARSAAQGAMTPRKQMVAGGGERRDVSAPAARAVRGGS